MFLTLVDISRLGTYTFHLLLQYSIIFVPLDIYIYISFDIINNIRNVAKTNSTRFSCFRIGNVWTLDHSSGDSLFQETVTQDCTNVVFTSTMELYVLKKGLSA